MRSKQRTNMKGEVSVGRANDICVREEEVYFVIMGWKLLYFILSSDVFQVKSTSLSPKLPATQQLLMWKPR